jgi:NADH-quinone oxidoreductase subunit A
VLGFGRSQALVARLDTVLEEDQAKEAILPQGYFGQYITIGIFTMVAAVLVLGTLSLSRLLRPNVVAQDKLTTYESGIDPIGIGWSQTSVRYYIFALLFVIFDIEAIFLFPWAVVFQGLGTQAFVEMIVFIAILALALLYAIKKKVLAWL